jgi:hypothetical protein
MTKVRAVAICTKAGERKLKVVITGHERIIRLSKSARCTDDPCTIWKEKKVSRSSDAYFIERLGNIYATRITDAVDLL